MVARDDPLQGMLAHVQGHMQRIAQGLADLPWAQVARALELLHAARLRRALVFLCGNGGSAATAAHWVNDLNKGTNVQGVPRFRAIGLMDNLPLLTAWSNDAHYAEAFVEPLRNLGRPGDLLVALSGSGNSPNVVQAVRYAREIGMCTIGFTGGHGGQLAALADVAIVVPSADMEEIEDLHLALEHAMIGALRARAQEDLGPSLLLAESYGACTEINLPKRGAIFLDRDGVINADRPDYVKSWEEVTFLPGAGEALAALAATGLPIVVVSNQAAINRRLLSFEVAESINRRLLAWAAAQGARLDAVAWCPHTPEEGCGCRKPQPGLLTHAAEVLRLDLLRSYLVGDAESDIAAGRAVGCRTILVLTGRGAAQRAQVEQRWPDCPIVPDLAAAARWLLADLAAQRRGDG
jgi:histidinol-phosphate phosphatase family protein